MNAPRYLAWLYDLDRGVALTGAGRVAMVEGDASVRQAILVLLSTMPGERVMRPDYGCDLHKLAFSPNDDTTAGLAIHYVRQALQRWEPRVEILRLDAVRYPDRPEELILVLDYRVRGSLESSTLTVPVNLAGAQT
jgi:phage baseplate assembly protein W